MGRPAVYPGDALISVASKRARSKLQQNSERRAIINVIIDKGGKTTIAALCDHFGFDMRAKVAALISAGWLEVEVPETEPQS